MASVARADARRESDNKRHISHHSLANDRNTNVAQESTRATLVTRLHLGMGPAEWKKSSPLQKKKIKASCPRCENFPFRVCRGVIWNGFEAFFGGVNSGDFR